MLHIWLSVFHGLLANGSDLGETAHVYLQEGKQHALLESAIVYLFDSPIRLCSKHIAVETNSYYWRNKSNMQRIAQLMDFPEM